MKYFLALVPPDALIQQIEEFRTPWGQAKTKPHITVKAPNSLTNPDHWLPLVTELCQRVTPFEVILSGVSQFGTTTLYLRVLSPALIVLHQELMQVVKPPLTEQSVYFEGAAYLPHLTLAHTESGITETDLAAMLPLAATEWAHPTSFVADTLTIYRASASGQPYEWFQAVPFTGPS